MLELLFRGFLEWTYGLILECWEYFSSVLFDLMSLDFAYLETYMPIITTIRQIMLGVGWALLLGNLVFQATRSMVAGIGFEADDPKLLFTRTFVFSFLLVASPQICDICLNMTSVIIDMVQMPDAATIKLPDAGIFAGLTASWLLVIVFGLIVMFQTCKLFFEMAERYFILAVLTITAPLAFGVGGSRSTSDIFSGWCRMYGSMCLLMVMNVVFVKMLLSILSFHPSGLVVLPWIVMVLTVVKVGVLEIPAMELIMPVYLGASDAHLAAGAAVLGNTSALIGGDNTNSVIAGHRGWKGADYFRHIDRLQVSDTVKLTNLWETLTYTVADIQIIQPHEVEKIKIQPNRDLLTLLTCHPYASGGRQRYVVYCERIED